MPMATEWGKQVSINYKFDACAAGTGIEDIERGQQKDIHYTLWQADTSAARNSWSYTYGNDYKKPEEIIQNLIDIVSKNGTMMLNIGPKADRSLPEEDIYILKEIGKWLTINGEGIYDTKNWKIFGEGPTIIDEGHFSDSKRAPYTCKDVRYTYKKGILYAFILKWPANGIVKMTNFAPEKKKVLTGVKRIKVLGYNEIPSWEQLEEGLVIRTETIDSNFPVCFRIEFI